jgi:hypothetical protein
LVIEIDGGIHHEQTEADIFRSQELEAQGYRVIRFTNLQVKSDLESVLADIQAACQPKPLSCSRERGRGEGDRHAGWHGHWHQRVEVAAR